MSSCQVVIQDIPQVFSLLIYLFLELKYKKFILPIYVAVYFLIIIFFLHLIGNA